MAPRKTQKKKEGKIIIKKTPLLPGHLSPCHPRQDGTRSAYNTTVKGIIPQCLPAKYHSILQIGSTECHDGSVSYTHKERCALKESSAFTADEKRELLKKYFRPEMPSEWFNDPDAWLSSLDIEAVMEQYEESDPSFKFLGVVPIDFSSPEPVEDLKMIRVTGGQQKCIANEYCTLDLKTERARGIRTIGCVFNLDPHDKNGSHWIACAILLKPVRGGSIYYFDSYGTEPPPQIAQFMRSFILQDRDLVLKYNGRRFQYGGSECGMYSMYFVICMLNRVPFQRFVRHTVADKYMLELRKILFS